VGSGLALVGLGLERIGKHVICFGGVVQCGKQPRVGADLAEPMPHLYQRCHAGSGEGAPPALPALDGVRIHSEMLGERLLGEAGVLTDELEQITRDEALAWSPIRPEPAAGTCRP
jgi:hypothetical protein